VTVEPPLPKGTIMAQEDQLVAAEASIPVDVSMYFTPTTGLTYTAKSSDMTKATATVAGNMVTIRGVAEGMARVTVTATNSAGMAMQTIAVTVTPADAKHKPRTLTIGGVGMGEDISLDEGQSLESRDRSKVTVAEKSGMGNLWTITAVKKGAAEVRIWNANRTIDQPPIKVTVMNTDPKAVDPLRSTVAGVSSGVEGDEHVTIDDKGVYKRAAPDLMEPTGPGAKNRLYHLADVDYSRYFSDEDGFPSDIPKDGFKAISNEPDVKVVGIPTATGVAIDVRRNIVSGFPLVIYVMDKDGGKSEEVTITVGDGAEPPLADMYQVSQDQGDGDFGTGSAEKVYLREDKTHTLTVKGWTIDDAGATVADGFRFVDVFRKELAKQYPATNPASLQGVSTDLGAATINPSSQPAAEANVEPYYTVTVSKTGPVEIMGGAGDEAREFKFVVNVPTLKFRVTDTGSATVKFTYYVVVKTVEEVEEDADAGTPAVPPKYEWKNDSETLRLNIVSGS
jgi:hypothetical protein